MSDQQTLGDRWREFTPSKALWFWSCAGCAVATVLLGFTVGGWVTGGTAAAMSESSAEGARDELVASLCVERFMAADGAAADLASLKEADSWDRDNFVVDGGWVTLTAFDEPFEDAADICAEQLVAMEIPVTVEEVAVDGTATDDATGVTTDPEAVSDEADAEAG